MLYYFHSLKNSQLKHYFKPYFVFLAHPIICFERYLQPRCWHSINFVFMVWLGKSVPYYRHWVKNSQLPNNNTNTFRMSLIFFSGVIVSQWQLQSLSPSWEKREKNDKLKWHFCCLFFLFLSQFYYVIFFPQRISIHTWPTPKVTVEHERVPKSFSDLYKKNKSSFLFSEITGT